MLRRRFPPKRRWWVAPSLVATVVMVPLAIALVPSTWVVAAMVVLALAYLVLVVTEWYELGGTELVVVRWPFRKRYFLENIVRVRGASRDGGGQEPGAVVVELEGHPSRVLHLTPQDREAFLRLLRYRAPHVSVEP